MVPLNIDFYKLKEELQKEIVTRIEKIEISNYPLEVAWLLYALSKDSKDNVFLKEKLGEFEDWILSDSSEIKNKDLAPLSLGSYLSEKEEVRKKAIEKITSILDKDIRGDISKFHVLNDPEQIFCLSLLSKKIPQELKENVVRKINENINGRIYRKILFLAALFEFEAENNIHRTKTDTIINEIKTRDIIDIINVVLVLWFVERYRNKITIDIDILHYWKLFENVYSAINIQESKGRKLLCKDLALLYEAVLTEIKEPNPDMLFDLYPFDDEIRKISYDSFKKKEYTHAVLEAIKKLNEILQTRTGIKEKSEVQLVNSTMNGKEPIIQFYDCYDKSGQSEQDGLAKITEGIFKAFRNPKAHKPKDNPQLQMKPYEALSQLITIDYILKRVKKAKIKGEARK
ncbi:hypothetical protein HRbin04_00594 [archaeon HR04]|jgi:uncharacterized protein (TIGR02391 family)|nr:hypothetical protein HRbin04_00594 [archaeon HR04]